MPSVQGCIVHANLRILNLVIVRERERGEIFLDTLIRLWLVHAFAFHSHQNNRNATQIKAYKLYFTWNECVLPTALIFAY